MFDNNLPKILIKVSLSILLILCLYQMPYSYYIFVRYMGFVGFGFLAYYAYNEINKISEKFLIYSSLALLFQPFIKVFLGRKLWNFIDIILAILLILTLFYKIEDNKIIRKKGS